MDGRRVFITGLGVALAQGTDPRALLPGHPRTDRRVDPVAGLTGRGMRYKDRATKLALTAGRAALAAAGLWDGSGPTGSGEAVAVVVSSNYGNVDSVCEIARTITRESYLAGSPMMLPATASNVTASWVAITHGLRGPNLTFGNGAASGLDAVHWARRLIVAGRARAALVIGVEPDNDEVRRLRAGSGLVDGAGAAVLESGRGATDRGARRLAAVGPYARAGSHDAAVAAVRSADRRMIGLWCRPPRPVGGECRSGEQGGIRLDLTALLGDCSGALGVLQCVAGAAWLDQPGPGPGGALASAGGHGTDPAAALLLTTPGGDR